MNVFVELGDDLARALLELTGVVGLEEAVVIAAESYVRHKRLERFRALKGKVNIMSNEELEAAELDRIRQLWSDSLKRSSGRCMGGLASTCCGSVSSSQPEHA